MFILTTIHTGSQPQGQFVAMNHPPAPTLLPQDCVLTLDNRDYLCRKVTGEMDFS